METLVFVINIAALIASVSVLIYVLVTSRGRSGDTASGGGVGGGELRQEFATQRGELGQNLAVMQQQFDARLQQVAADQTAQLARDREAQTSAAAEQREQLNQALAGLSDRFHQTSQASLQSQVDLKAAVEARFEELRIANEAKLEQVRTTVDEKLQGTLKTALAENAQRVQTLTDTHVAKQAELQETLRAELEKLRQGNEAKLEKMRETVDEKLQGTLEKRLGESFKLVSDRLEQVQKGLGEMQTLASDVGGLKRVLTNVKSRGSWGEVQLERQLEDILTPEQYEQNAVIRPGSAERVEFAVKLPGRGETERVLLPIDSKFPQEDYERLLEAQESGEKEAVEAAVKVLERVILTQAKLIAEKYIAPPHSTDFAIMYLPTEGLFAEVVRRPGLASKLQNELRIIVTGPTTLGSLLNSLQMGFRTLAIEKRSSEVWQVLSAAKQEFQKYGQVWEKLEKQLATAQNTVHQAGVRTRAVAKQLRSVETLGTEALSVGQSPIEDMFTDFDEPDAKLGEEQESLEPAETSDGS